MSKSKSRFYFVNKSSIYSDKPPNVYIITDLETGVQYLCLYIENVYGIGTAITPLLDKNGEPTIIKKRETKK